MLNSPQLSKCDYVAEQLKDKIVSGYYKNGDQLPPEPALCELFGVSRVTVREALKKLNMMGLVDIKQGKGTFVKAVDLAVFMRPLFQRINFHEIDVEAIYAARAVIEGGAAALAAQLRTEDDLESLRTIVENLKTSIELDNSPDIGRYDIAFHQQIAKIARNPILCACIETLEEISRACVKRRNRYYGVLDNSYSEHYAIYAAIEKGDATAAEQAMRLHAENSKKFLL